MTALFASKCGYGPGADFRVAFVAEAMDGYCDACESTGELGLVGFLACPHPSCRSSYPARYDSTIPAKTIAISIHAKSGVMTNATVVVPILDVTVTTIHRAYRNANGRNRYFMLV